jgi:hypothetical protein
MLTIESQQQVEGGRNPFGLVAFSLGATVNGRKTTQARELKGCSWVMSTLPTPFLARN